MKLEVGQKLWYVPSGRHIDPHEVTVEKVGRKWAEIGPRLRINVETLRADGGAYSSPGSAYLSRGEYEAERALDRAWSKFQDLARRHWGVPKGVGLSQIENAAQSLFGQSVLEQADKRSERQT